MSVFAVTSFDNAIVRRPASSIANGLRSVDVGPPNYEDVLREHEAYCLALRTAGVAVEELDALEDFPDSVFVEDTALVFGDGAILLRPGASSRFGEAAAIRPTLERRFPTLIELPAAGFVDGGDVLVLPDRVLIGLSARTDQAGAEALVAALARLGRKGEVVRTPLGVLHFKSDCALLDEETVLATARLSSAGFFDGLDVVVVPDGDEPAANALRINDTLFVSDAYPRTAEGLAADGFHVITLSTREIAKVDAGLSCMSLRWRAR